MDEIDPEDKENKKEDPKDKKPEDKHKDEFDPQALHEAIQEGMDTVEKNTDPTLAQTAYTKIEEIAVKQEEFTADDVWKALEGLKFHNNSALGPVFKKAQKAGLIRTVGTFRRSERVKTHGKPLPIWIGV